MTKKIEKIFIASDHKGYNLKEFLVTNIPLKYHNIQVIDLGTNDTNSVDYPDYSSKLCEAILENHDNSRGILICNTGIGMTIAANRNSDIRAANCLNNIMAYKARQHNNINVLVLGERFVTTEETLEILKIFLETDFEGGRHTRRLKKI